MNKASIAVRVGTVHVWVASESIVASAEETAASFARQETRTSACAELGLGSRISRYTDSAKSGGYLQVHVV